MIRWAAAVLIVAVVLTACGGGDAEPKETSTRTEATGQATTTETLSIASDAFREGEAIPERFTCEGDNLSPELSWSGLPEGTAALALVMDDPDAPGGTFTHWLLYDMSARTRSLAENTLTVGDAEIGVNGANRVGYTGPCPPPGQTHTYVFTIYALDDETGLEPGATANEVHAAIEGHVLASGTLTGTFGR
jgi:Raf kinase inhibitor-like YbhB/YbcL family protein